jgi:hypothetical protein
MSTQTARTITTRSPRTREEVELELLAFELTERRVALLLSVAMTIVAAVCALRGAVWTVPAGTGLAAVGFVCWPRVTVLQAKGRTSL